MIHALLALLGFQLVGEILVRALAVPVPGPVIGMLLLFGALRIKGNVAEPLQQSAQNLLGNLSLLFVPAGVGVMVHLTLIRNDWWRLLIVLIVSTLVTMLVTALVMQGTMRLRRSE